MHLAGTREEWLAARLKLLKEEKELTRRGDELAWRQKQSPSCCGKKSESGGVPSVDSWLAMISWIRPLDPRNRRQRTCGLGDS
jgi:hypothetical protein